MLVYTLESNVNWFEGKHNVGQAKIEPDDYPPK